MICFSLRMEIYKIMDQYARANANNFSIVLIVIKACYIGAQLLSNECDGVQYHARDDE